MAGFEASEHIARPPDEVWSFFNDHGNARKWLPGILELKQITDGPVGLGTRFHETRRMGKKEHTATLEITEYDEGRRYAGTVEEMGVRGTYTYTFAPDGGGTRVDLVAEVKGKGLAKVMVPIVVMTMKKQDGDQLARLKAAIEGDP